MHTNSQEAWSMNQVWSSTMTMGGGIRLLYSSCSPSNLLKKITKVLRTSLYLSHSCSFKKERSNLLNERWWLLCSGSENNYSNISVAIVSLDLPGADRFARIELSTTACFSRFRLAWMPNSLRRIGRHMFRKSLSFARVSVPSRSTTPSPSSYSSFSVYSWLKR